MFDRVLSAVSNHPEIIANVQKLGNGYVLTMERTPAPPPAAAVAEGLSPDEMIDKLVDGMGALVRSINDNGAGEDWKSEENRQTVREAFKVMFPGMAAQVQRMSLDGPRYENLVFESKEKLIEYLGKNL